MDQKDVAMEDAGQLLEDEVVGGQECVEKDQITVNEAGNKLEEASGLVNTEVQSQNEIGVEQEVQEEKKEQDELRNEDAEEIHPNKSKQEDQEELKNEVAEEVIPHKRGQEVQEEPRNEDTEEIHINIREQELPVDETKDIEKDDATMDNRDKVQDSKTDATVITNDDSENDAVAVADDDKIHDMDDNHGVIKETDHDGSQKIPEINDEEDYTGDGKHHQLSTPDALVTYSHTKAEDHCSETPKNELEDTKMDDGYESGTAEEQEAFMREVDAIYKEKRMEFKPPKFYGQPLNCLKLWRSVIKLGGYDRVTGAKWWRQVGEAFHPPKTCTTVSWTFRQFYEKALLEYERHKVQTREIELPLATVFPEAPTVDSEVNGHQTPGSGSGRARRDAASRAMQGWHTQRLLGFGSEEKSSNNSHKREKSLKSIGSSLKQKRPSEVEHSVKAARTETSRQVVTTVADIGAPANWVKINVRETKDGFEVYALVPGLLREEVRVQSDPAGRLVITGQPEQLDNPWGISAFKKVISLPGRIDPLRTSAIVSLHGRLLVRVPFEQSNV